MGQRTNKSDVKHRTGRSSLIVATAGQSGHFRQFNALLNQEIEQILDSCLHLTHETEVSIDDIRHEQILYLLIGLRCGIFACTVDYSFS